MEKQFHEMNYGELRELYLLNCAMETIEQCNTLLSVIRAFDVVRPRETEHQGERISNTDLNTTRMRAMKRRGFLQATARPATVIVPPEKLR